ncbi:uncharacterized protein V6R79_011814 [Siganus canaliculatus]
MHKAHEKQPNENCSSPHQMIQVTPSSVKYFTTKQTEIETISLKTGEYFLHERVKLSTYCIFPFFEISSCHTNDLHKQQAFWETMDRRMCDQGRQVFFLKDTPIRCHISSLVALVQVVVTLDVLFLKCITFLNSDRHSFEGLRHRTALCKRHYALSMKHRFRAL